MAGPTISLVGGKSVGGLFPCFIIAEIGQNHQGSINIAKKLIHIAKECGADCVKFQKSCLAEKFTEGALARPYTSPHSWGETYGQHKQFLEFSLDQYRELQKYSQDIGIMFSASGMDSVSITFLDSIEVPFIKIGSGDADNLLLIEEAAKLNKPLFISTGMQDMEDVCRLHEVVRRSRDGNCQMALLHCVSAYPAPATSINLRVLSEYQHRFPDTVIGYSGHELGTAISVAAVSLGAKIIERHLTLSKQWKGSDHCCSLEPDEFKQMVKDIRTVEQALGSPVKQFLSCERSCYQKLGKSIVAARDLTSGSVLTQESVKIKVSEPSGLSCKHLSSLLGKTLNKDIKNDEPILLDSVSE
ncbi:sialic acid synthase-like isoform X2 [Macrosteles quadrilineatus]|uniref:sialic acid synthase-like isoform X2 n=1 Tax=Macrosteles quadrilineatus TaxID=74068 RepID=UPI0023E15448|nr:sialic acid synthase-like isoform X2 [Macrosteles quadrilineatus]XP_054268108.1 sialic acid synthase-like isoform X2 [Macrosteles quadrilineatus]XP_054268116.1 sialic acid synthase-like isoform X2 [Macrosteles quadrilineatus]XP_054268124.1 sialic acid synthase-like isoform X2 [Macrosteles quadrilineatus]